MNRAEFVFSIGFQGDAAIVDKRAMRSYRGLSTAELAEQGLFRQAFCSALYAGDPEEMRQFVELFSRQTGVDGLTAERLKRLFGVYTVPDDVTKVIAV
jgi:hypothetical protein